MGVLRSVPGILGGAGSPPLRMASAFNRVSTNRLTASVTDLKIATRTAHFIGSGDCSELRVLLNNVGWTATNAVQATGNEITFTDVYLERAGITSVRLTFGGSNSVTLTDGQTDVLSDPIYPNAFGLATFARDTQWNIRTLADIPLGTAHPIKEGTDGPSGVEGKSYNPAVTTLNNLSAAAAFSFTGTAATNSFGSSCMLVGKFVSGDPRVWFGAGDSIFAAGNRGSYFTRALRGSGTNHIAGVQTGRSGGVASSLSAALGRTLVKYCNGAVEEYNTNGISGITLLQLQVTSQAAWTNILSSVLASPTPFKIIRTALLLSTNGNGDPATQTVTARWGAGELVEQFNDWLATQEGIGFDIYADCSLPLRASGTKGATDYYKWNTLMCQADGLHPVQLGADPAGDVLRTFMLAV